MRTVRVQRMISGNDHVRVTEMSKEKRNKLTTSAVRSFSIKTRIVSGSALNIVVASVEVRG